MYIHLPPSRHLHCPDTVFDSFQLEVSEHCLCRNILILHENLKGRQSMAACRCCYCYNTGVTVKDSDESKAASVALGPSGAAGTQNTTGL